MKKIVITLACAFGLMNANAQFESGTIMLTGGINFSQSSSERETKMGSNTTTTEGPVTTNFGLGVMGGYFVADNIAVGLGLGYGSFSSEDTDDGVTYETSGSLFSITPFARYYIPYTDVFSFFGELSVGIGAGSDKFSTTSGGNTTTQEASVSTLRTGIAPGFNFFVHENIALEIKYGFLGYNSFTTERDFGNDNSVKDSSSNFGLNLDLTSLVFGLSVFF